jgi:AcrR family transcriptional regulator
MTPRRYDMSRRAQAREDTRHRIVEATARLHGERGIFGTSWRDIAREADVSVATVYSHFPSLDELLPACGALVMERARPPRADQAAEFLRGVEGLCERLERVARELFLYYERGGPHLEVDVRERELPGMREWEESQRAMVTAFVRAAVAGAGADAQAIRLGSALLDMPTFKALRARGLAVRTSARMVARLVACAITEGHSYERTED